MITTIMTALQLKGLCSTLPKSYDEGLFTSASTSCALSSETFD